MGMISPILPYNSEVWGAFVKSDYPAFHPYKRQKVSLKKRPNRRPLCYSDLRIMVNVPNLFLASFFISSTFYHISMTTLLQLSVLTPAEVQLQFLSRSLSIMIEAAHALTGKQGRFPFSQNFRNFRFGSKWNTFRRFVPLENSQKKWKI